MGINFKKPAAPAVQSSAEPQQKDFIDHLGGVEKKPDPGPSIAVSPVGEVATEQASAKLSVVNTLFDPATKTKTILAEKHTTIPVTPTVDPIPADKLAKVSVGAGRKINLGNYESADVSVHLSLPAHVDKLDETYARITAWIEKKMDDALSNDVEPVAKK